ncbi:tail fiber domain-containing protein [Leclercia sp. GLN_9]|uniref:tail fiber domain-containing protein n=1 Tax=Leclercia sp. GLN_9 TaxID=3367184 RepID=UPI00370C1143
MTKYATKNPLGSMDPKDFFDNAQNFDIAANDITKAFWVDRFGRSRQSLFGMEQRFNLFIQNSGYKVIGDYTAGPLTITEYNQVIRYEGELWKITASTNIPFTTTGNDAASWSNDSAHFVSIGDGTLRQELLRKRVYAVDFGNVPDGTDPNKETSTIQSAIDYVYANGGGVVDLGPFHWKVNASTLNETYDNFGVAVSSDTGCIILRKGVSLVGQYGKTKISSDNPELTIIYLVAPDGNIISGFELSGAWSEGKTGSGHGIFQLGTQGGTDISCRRTIFEYLYIHNVASYGIGLQNGNPEDCHISYVSTDTTGADGLDLKARDDIAIPPVANTVSNVWVKRYNLRLDGSAGLDIRGVWQASNITVTDFGGDTTKTYIGIRFRTKPVATDPYNKAAAKSTLTGFNITPTTGAAALLINGIECGSDDVHISNGTTEGCHVGVVHSGNAVGSAQRCTVMGVTSINAKQYGFRNAVGCDDIKYVGCVDIGSATSGFRPEGTNCTMVGNTGSLSVGTSALPTFLQVGGRHGASYVNLERQNDTSVSVTAKGAVADITLRLSVKGAGFVGVNADVRPDTANTKYLGSGSLPWAGGFTQTAFTVTSGAKFKTEPLEITDDMLDAVEECPPIQYQLLDRVAIKGADNARWHFGTIAERLEEAFSRHGLDVRRYAFFCEDHVPYSAAVIDEETGDVLEPEQKEEIRLGVRYEELLMLEAALLRRNNNRLKVKMDELLVRVESLETKA